MLMAPTRLEDINKHCLAEFRAHWQCLERHNQQMWECRGWERPLNKCVFDSLVLCLDLWKRTVLLTSPQGLEKVIPGTPQGELPVHLREKQVFQSWWAFKERPNPNKPESRDVTPA